MKHSAVKKLVLALVSVIAFWALSSCVTLSGTGQPLNTNPTPTDLQALKTNIDNASKIVIAWRTEQETFVVKGVLLSHSIDMTKYCSSSLVPVLKQKLQKRWPNKSIDVVRQSELTPDMTTGAVVFVLNEDLTDVMNTLNGGIALDAGNIQLADRSFFGNIFGTNSAASLLDSVARAFGPEVDTALKKLGA